ncbi:family with sequence similarity 129, member A [Chelydra serpentina]|uniref:Family with sequence similarity 129, member A n=1 Tax=Chelydra serpentina TaxID=8475 RepID=A0A8T1SPG3_CHESE|nr:family with sequence similarity 129, member A [Chelydra serpentina]
MGGSASSLLDESKCSYIRGKTEAVIKNFSPHYQRQYAVAFCEHIQNELEQHRDFQSQFLKTKPPVESGMILYEAELLHFAEDLKKWKERYIVIRNDYAVQSFESKEAFQKGVSPKYHILPAGGKVLTSEEDYNLLSDKHFPDPVASNEKENAQAFVLLPKEFPVYLWQPYLRHSYYCFEDPDAQKQFSAVLNDCVRHLNQDFLKQTTFEVQAFLEAVQFFRQEKGHYGSWEMITGNEIQILSNLVMEELLPNLQTMLLPKMKGKRNDRKRAWFAIVEETYNLVQEQVSEGLNTLKEECKDLTKNLEGTIRSDMDQILNSKNYLAGKIKATVSEPAEKCCMENIQPFLPSILEELMGPVSSGFSEVRLLFEKEVNEISQNFQKTNDATKLKENLEQLMNLPFNSVKMEPCYLKVHLLQEPLQDLKSRFKFYHIDFVVERTQNFMQELMENAVYTFEHLLSPSSQGDTVKISTAIEKVKLRVLKQYDYDSSTIRKKIFQEALVQITLPTMQKTLASACKPELQKYEQYIFADYTRVIQVENVYEEILFQTLLDETLKVIKEAAILKKHNLFEDSVNLPCESVSSLTDLKTPSGSAQASPAKKLSTTLTETSDTETQSNELLVVSEKMTQEKCHDARKPSDTEEADYVNVSSSPAISSEKVIITDINEKLESYPFTPKEEKDVEEMITSQNENAVETEFGGNTEKETKVQEEERSLTVPDTVNEIRSLLMVTVELPAVAPSENKKEVVNECQILKWQEHGEESDENSKTNAETSQTDQIVNKEVEHSELKVEQPPLSSLVTGDMNLMIISEAGNHAAQTECWEVSEKLDVSQESKAEMETNQSVWYTGLESCKGLHDKSHPEAHTESIVGDRRSDLEEAGEGHIHAVPMETEAESFPGCSAESPAATQIPILSIENLSIETTDDFQVSLVLEEDELSTAEVTVDIKSESFTVTASDECQLAGAPSLSAEITSSVGSETVTQENSEESCTGQHSEE